MRLRRASRFRLKFTRRIPGCEGTEHRLSLLLHQPAKIEVIVIAQKVGEGRDARCDSYRLALIGTWPRSTRLEAITRRIDPELGC
jgi:hypothetical protein